MAYISGVSEETLKKLAEYEAGATNSAATNSAYANLQNLQSTKPTYTNNYAERLQELYDQINNTGPFTYDMNADALYNQYKDQYTRLGSQAMQDTMGQAAALTGGYGSSYATTAGNQAYQSYLQQLNNIVPDLYSQAQTTYQNDLSNKYNQYNLAQTAESNDYAKYQDTLSSYYNDVSLATDAYNTERNYDYNTWSSMLDYYSGKATAENTDYWNKYSASHSGGSGSGSASKTDPYGDLISLTTNPIMYGNDGLSTGVTVDGTFYTWDDLADAIGNTVTKKVADDGTITFKAKHTSPVTKPSSTNTSVLAGSDIWNRNANK